MKVTDTFHIIRTLCLALMLTNNCIAQSKLLFVNVKHIVLICIYGSASANSVLYYSVYNDYYVIHCQYQYIS